MELLDVGFSDIEALLSADGIRNAVLTADVPTDKREAWFAKRLEERIQVTISHPKIIETGIDYVEYEIVADLTISLEISSGQRPARYPLALRNADLAHRRGG